MTYETGNATSHTMATFLMVGITILLAAMILLVFHLPSLELGSSPSPIFEIESMDHIDEITGKLNYDSRLRFVHNGTENYHNNNLKAVVYRNGGEWSCAIETLSGSQFIPSHHYNIQWMGGSGCSGLLFTPREQVVIDFTDRTFHPGDIVRLDVINRDSGGVISTHTFRVK
jgi:hypothetical protein